MWTSRAAVLRQTGVPMTIETLEVGPLAVGDVLVRVRAASLCHIDLEAIEGALQSTRSAATWATRPLAKSPRCW